MLARVKKWGNSLALRIPISFADQAGIVEGTEVDLFLDQGEIRVRARRPPRYRLEELLEEITPTNLHGEENAGPSVGREAW